MQTKSYSGRGGGGPLQQSALKHCQGREKQSKNKRKMLLFLKMFIQQSSKNQVYKFKGIGEKQVIIQTFYFNKTYS